MTGVTRYYGLFFPFNALLAFILVVIFSIFISMIHTPRPESEQIIQQLR